MESESLYEKCKSCGKMVLKSEEKCPSCGNKINKYGGIKWILIIVAVIYVIGKFGSTDSALTNSKISEQSKKDKILENLKLDYKWSTSGFGSVMMADLKIKNNSDTDIKDVQIVCEHSSSSGTKIDSNSTTIYEIFKAKSTRNFPDYNMGFIHSQAKSSACYIKSFSLMNQ